MLWRGRYAFFCFFTFLNNLEALDIGVLKLECKFLRDACIENNRGHIVIEEGIYMAEMPWSYGLL
jgi:hypothetical protein